jgi:hypothetical protein
MTVYCKQFVAAPNRDILPKCIPRHYFEYQHGLFLHFIHIKDILPKCIPRHYFE